jgi:hypothetical protein
LAQVLTANGLDAAAPAGRMAQSGPSSPEDGEPEVTGGLTPHPNSPVKAATELKDDNYRASWKFCLAAMRKELQSRSKCRHGFGPAAIPKRALQLYSRAPA